MNKALSLLLLSVIFQFKSFSQYRCIPDFSGGNPQFGNFYSDPNLDANNYEYYGSTTVLTNVPTPVWSAVYPINFPFFFNGAPASYFKVSSTGIVTFDTSATQLPPAYDKTFPSPLIPDNSICIRGLMAGYSSGSYTSAVSFIYKHGSYSGSNRDQLWISFKIFSDSLNSTYSYTTWSVVLEEYSDKVYFVEHYNAFTEDYRLTLGIQINPTTFYAASGSPFIPVRECRLGYTNDNIYYEFAPALSVSTDLAVKAAPNSTYLDLSDAPLTISADIKNMAYDTIRNFEIHYQVDNSPVVTETVNGLLLPCGEVLRYDFSALWTPADSGNYSIHIWTSLPNGISDEDISNDDYIYEVYISPQLPHRKVMCEEFKERWCMWSDTYDEKYDSLAIGLNKAKVIAVKYDDFFQNRLGYTNVNPEPGYERHWIPITFHNGSIIETDSVFWPAFPGCAWNLDQQRIDSLYNLHGLFDVQPKLEVNGYTGTVSGAITSLVNFKPENPCRYFAVIYIDTFYIDVTYNHSYTSRFLNTTLKTLTPENGWAIGSPQYGHKDSIDFTFSITDTLIDMSRLNVAVYVQDTITKEIYQCADAAAIQLCAPSHSASVIDFCHGDSVLIEGNYIKSTGTYSYMHTGADGCDSLHQYFVTDHWAGGTISQSGTELRWGSLFGAYNTAAISWYDVTNQTIIPGTTVYPPANYPAPFTPPGNGPYALIFVDSLLGCTTFSNIIDYCPLFSYNVHNYNFCRGDSVQVNNHWYSAPGMYKDTLTNYTGCDSVIVTKIVYNSVTGNHSIAICDGDSVQVGNHWYSEDGNYLDTLMAASGCDSLLYTHISYILNGSLNQVSSCFGDSVNVNSHWYTVPGIYKDTLVSAIGCDSILTTAFSWNNNTVTVINSGNVLMAIGNAGSYQWLDCNNGYAAIPSASSQSFTPAQSGSYAVAFTQNGCTDTSHCNMVTVTGVDSHSKDESFMYYPNPTTGVIYFDFKTLQNNVCLQLIDVTGKLINEVNYSGVSKISYSINGVAGFYYVILRSGDRESRIKVLKQ